MEKPTLTLIAAADEPEPTPASDNVTPAPESSAAPAPSAEPAPPETPKQRANPFLLAREKNWKALSREFKTDIAELLQRYPDISARYTVLGILDKTTLIGSTELDRMYSGLQARDTSHDRDVLLILLSTGGSVEPAYQISKLCQYFAKEKFVACVPRYAKSAATLIALGADEIHMGRLGELGPIDPQVQRLPALAVGRALEVLAQLAQKYPGSSDMLAKYLGEVVGVQQIGHFERVAESAVQYAQRLLTKKFKQGVLPSDPEAIAKKLVHEYKDHGFVIDVDEARELLGKATIREDSQETRFADELYSLYDYYSLVVQMSNTEHTLLLIGSLHPDDIEMSFLPFKQRRG